MNRTLPCASLAACVLLSACGAGNAVDVEVVELPQLLGPLRDAAQAYVQAHPGSAVQVSPRSRLRTLLRLGRAPDAVVIDSRRVAGFADDGALEPVADEPAAGDFYAPALDAFRYGGALQCLPASAGTDVVYYNRTLFAHFKVPAPAADWNSRDFVDAARRLNRQDLDGDGQPDTWGLGFEPTLARLAPFLWSAGLDLVDDPVQPTHLAIDRPQALRVLSWVKQLNTRYGLVPPEEAHESVDERTRFLRGQLGMLIADRAYTVRLRQATDLDWDVAPLPRLARPASLLDAQGYCLGRDPRHRTQAQAFIAWAAGDEGQALLARGGSVVPSRPAVAQSPAFLDPTAPPASAHVFLDQLASARALTGLPRWHAIETAADPRVAEWFFESLKDGEHGGDPDEGGGEAAELVTSLREVVNPLLLPQSRPPPAR